MQYLKTYEGIFQNIKSLFNKSWLFTKEEEDKIMQLREKFVGVEPFCGGLRCSGNDREVESISVRAGFRNTLLSLTLFKTFGRIKSRIGRIESLDIKSKYKYIIIESSVTSSAQNMIFGSDSLDEIIKFIKQLILRKKIIYAISPKPIHNSRVVIDYNSLIDDYGIIIGESVSKFRLRDLIEELVEKLPTEWMNNPYKKVNTWEEHQRNPRPVRIDVFYYTIYNKKVDKGGSVAVDGHDKWIDKNSPTCVDDILTIATWKLNQVQVPLVD